MAPQAKTKRSHKNTPRLTVPERVRELAHRWVLPPGVQRAIQKAMQDAVKQALARDDNRDD